MIDMLEDPEKLTALLKMLPLLVLIAGAVYVVFRHVGSKPHGIDPGEGDATGFGGTSVGRHQGGDD